VEEEEEVVEEEEEVVVEEEISEETLATWEEIDLVTTTHWSQGYVKHLVEEQHIIEVAVSTPSFMEILTNVFATPNAAINREDSLEFLLVLSGYALDTMTINTIRYPFSDVDFDSENAAYIQYAYDEQLIQGYPDGTFRPGSTINRAEALKLATYFFHGPWTHPVYGDELLASFELTENPFSDVDINQWYAPYVIYAYKNGVVNGYGDGTFGPGNDVTYAEFLKIVTLMKDIENAIQLAAELE